MPESTVATNVTESDFKREVIEVSRKVPVMVDFWAAWCQPCLMLAPVLEEIAAHYGERIRLVKVDTDREPGLAQRYRVRGLPTVKLFVKGSVATEFTGVLPPARILALLEPHLPRPSDDAVRAACELQEAGRTREAAAHLREAMKADPENHRVPPLLAEMLLELEELDEAEKVIKELPVNLQQEPGAAAVFAKIGFARTAKESPDAKSLEAAIASDPENLDARFKLSARQVLGGEFEGAMENLLDIIRRDRSYRDDGARRALLDVFTLLNNEGPLVRRYRSLLSSALN